MIKAIIDHHKINKTKWLKLALQSSGLVANHVNVDFVVDIGIIFRLTKSKSSGHFKLRQQNCKNQIEFFNDQLTSPEPPAESKCTYNWFKVSLSFFCVFF